MVRLADLHSRLRAIVAQRMQTDPAHDLAHLDRVWTNAQAIAEDRADLLVLLSACYLHDLINLPKNDPDRHLASRQSAQVSEPILRDLGLDDHRIRAVQHAIEAHSFSANIPPRSTEARILRDADRLDALGAIGIARCFAVSGALGRALYDQDDPFAQERALDDLSFAIDHWKVKLLNLPDDMLTEGGRDLARKRVAQMRGFLEVLAQEVGHPLPDNWKTG
ncbi:HD domain-containing protein [Ruegeria sp. HKCCA6948]|uniref:HD domain-containing protein n=1 Tax=unclassified Ruegeria TaxID=2625375 RepID=UPI003530169C